MCKSCIVSQRIGKIYPVFLPLQLLQALNMIVLCFIQLELKLGLGGTSYADFIRSMHLPMQLRYANAAVVQSLFWFVPDNVAVKFSISFMVVILYSF